MASEWQILVDITMMLVVASVCTLVLSRLKMPTIIGYILAGVLLGPYIFPEYIMSEEILRVFSSMGIILLMFFIGIELNLRGLRKVASLALVIAVAEMTMMMLVGYSLAIAFGLSPGQAVFVGIIMSVASTAAILTIMPSSKHLTINEKRAITGILVMEDIILVIVISFAAPILSETNNTIFSSSLEMLVGIILFIAMTILLGIAVIPRILDWIRAHYTDEVLLLVSLALAFGMALISSLIGLSVAVGAFLIGIIISQSTCAATVCTRVEPMKELFIATFFISVGFAFNPSLFLEGLALTLVIAAFFIVGKLVFISSACYLANFNSRSCLYIATSLVAMGEFSFIVAAIALDGGLIDQYIYSAVVGAALVTLICMPFISRGAPRLFEGVKRAFPKDVRKDMDRGAESPRDLVVKEPSRPEVRKEVRRELLYIIIDLVLIAGVLIAVNVLAVLEGWIGDIGADLGVVPSLLAFFIGLILTLPLIFILVVRLKKLSRILASVVYPASGNMNRRRSAAGRVFKDLGEAFLALLLFLLFLPFLPQVEGIGFLPFIALILLAVLLTYFLWDAYKTAYRRVTSSIVRGLSDKDEESGSG
ncbi:MAG: cation:proton antiporter [Methanomassiliicoccales archaeon]|nr:cation:proton antiporter [Methanomassiliicoccales archaeon]MDD1755506.1 cation:proton antiporter [Methanomassiliicoccales archaeon]